MSYFILRNGTNCYNIFSTKEKAIAAVYILRSRLIEHLNDNIPDNIKTEFNEEPTIITGFQILDKYFYIFQINEGSGFGNNLWNLYCNNSITTDASTNTSNDQSVLPITKFLSIKANPPSAGKIKYYHKKNLLNLK
jgi:hypothetical protein